MLKTAVATLICAALLFSGPAFAIDGQILINQATVLAAGGFPYIITQPGSYKLSGNLVVSSTLASGISINANNVTIDLNGFTISGPDTCTGAGSSISCAHLSQYSGIQALGLGTGLGTGGNDVTVRNGSVIGFATGVFLDGAYNNNLVEEIHANGNSGDGIFVYNGVVRRNTASLNGAYGISAQNSTVTENVANFNGVDGLYIDGGVYGSNTFVGNGVTHGNAVSGNNNDCNGTAC